MTTEPKYTDAQIETMVARLLTSTPNWLRESLGDWKDVVHTYDRAPKDAADMLRTLLSERQAAMQGQGGDWIEGYPNKIYASEWFIAQTKNRERVVLTALPEEYAYDFTTADETYIKKENIVRWMQFPDSQFIPAFQPPQPVRSVSDDRLKLIREAVAANGGVWPEELTSGVLFWRGKRITRDEFAAITQEKQS